MLKANKQNSCSTAGFNVRWRFLAARLRALLSSPCLNAPTPYPKLVICWLNWLFTPNKFSHCAQKCRAFAGQIKLVGVALATSVLLCLQPALAETGDQGEPYPAENTAETQEYPAENPGTAEDYATPEEPSAVQDETAAEASAAAEAQPSLDAAVESAPEEHEQEATSLSLSSKRYQQLAALNLSSDDIAQHIVEGNEGELIVSPLLLHRFITQGDEATFESISRMGGGLVTDVEWLLMELLMHLPSETATATQALQRALDWLNRYAPTVAADVDVKLLNIGQNLCQSLAHPTQDTSQLAQDLQDQQRHDLAALKQLRIGLNSQTLSSDAQALETTFTACLLEKGLTPADLSSQTRALPVPVGQIKHLFDGYHHYRVPLRYPEGRVELQVFASYSADGACAIANPGPAQAALHRGHLARFFADSLMRFERFSRQALQQPQISKGAVTPLQTHAVIIGPCTYILQFCPPTAAPEQQVKPAESASLLQALAQTSSARRSYSVCPASAQ